LDASSYSELLLDQLTLAYLLREILPDRTNIKGAPLLGDLALRYAVDVDAYDSFLNPLRSQAGVLAPTDEAVPVLGDDCVTLGDLLLDGEAGGMEGVEDFLLGVLEVLTGRTLIGNQAAVDEVGAEQLVYDIEVPLASSSTKRRTMALFSSAEVTAASSSCESTP